MTSSEKSTAADSTGQSPAAPPPTVWGTLQATDAPALIDFLVGTVGFRATAVYRDGDVVAHAQLDWPEGGGIMLGTHKPGGEWSREPGSAGFYVVTDRVDELFAKVSAAGARIIRPLLQQDYGNREFTIADPEGNLWSFGFYRGEPPAS